MKSWKDDPRAATNPLFNDNKLKLGLFGLNAGHNILTKAPDRYVADWDRCDAAIGRASDLGIEAAVSLMGWAGPPELEPFTWAAGLGARHANPAVIATMHMQLNHPVFVAKAAATVDRITKGRMGLNLVAGSSKRTFDAFGLEIEDHETRYAHATEWMELVLRLWSSEEPFDFEGRFYKVTRALSQPKPLQSRPAIMNAGTSGRGKAFACQYADMVFTHVLPDQAAATAQVADYRAFARAEFDRDVQIWTHGYVVIRDTQKEAEEYLDYYAGQHADHEALALFVKELGMAAQSTSADEQWKFNRNWAAGGGVALVGTAEQVAERLGRLSAAGLDGVLLMTVEPERMLDHVTSGLLPCLEQAGLRKSLMRDAGRV